MPVAGALAGLIGSGWWADRVNQEQLAERMLAGISSDWNVSDVEAQEWRLLAGAGWSARFHAIRFTLSRPSIASKAQKKAALLAHAAIGLDPTGELSRQLVHEALLPVLEQCSPSSCAASGKIAGFLHIAAAEASALAGTLVECMKTEQDSDTLASLGEALAGLSGKVVAKDVQPLAATLVERMKTEEDRYALASLGEAVTGLSGKLKAKDVELLAAALDERRKTEQERPTLLRLGEALAGLGGKPEAKAVQPLAAVLWDAMKSWNEFEAIPPLATAWVSLERVVYADRDLRMLRLDLAGP